MWKTCKVMCASLMLAFLLSACESTPIPKPKGYFRIDLADKKIDSYTGKCPLTFAKPSYMKAEDLKNGMSDSCWFNLHIPQHRATLHLTYLKVEDNIEHYLQDSYSFVFKHDVKANAIDRERVSSKDGKSTGLLYDLRGEVATPIQFFITDSTAHFLRGSLYFDHQPNQDSIRPVLAHLRLDLVEIMQSIRWE